MREGGNQEIQGAKLVMSEARGATTAINETLSTLGRIRKRLYLGIVFGLLLMALYAANFALLSSLRVMNATMVAITIVLVIRTLRLLRQNLEACRRGQAALDEHRRFVTGQPLNPEGK